MNSTQNSKINSWVERISRSRLSVEKYISQHQVPFSIAQYYRYKKNIEQGTEIIDKRQNGNNRKLNYEMKGFLKGYMKSRPEAGLSELQNLLKEKFKTEVSKSGVSRSLNRLGCVCEKKPVEEKVEQIYVMSGGFELIIALAIHLGWPQSVSKVITEKLEQIKKSDIWTEGEKDKDKLGRNKRGQFTSKYNNRKDVRTKRFKSIEYKREAKNFQSMSITSVDTEILQRKSLAALSLPILTNNGAIRSIDTPLGNALLNLCGFNYKQATINKFLTELKYIGISETLLKEQVVFWQKHWQNHPKGKMELPLLCYYVDGNTRALWSKRHVKKNKVTMLGRVMGCLETVFVHDNYGRPIYFETYSGHAPVGEYILTMFKKIETSLIEPETKLHVNRAIVLDGANNSVNTLRSFALQDKYHYITSLDDNQWNPRKLRKVGRPQRYRYGKATLRDCEIELTDSQEKGYLIVVRAIKIEWDNGKITVLLTSISSEIVGAGEVVKAYFDRWPYQELVFKGMKSVASLHRVAGYGMQVVEDSKVVKRQKELENIIIELKKELKELLEKIAQEELTIASLIKKEYRLRGRSDIVDGNRIMEQKEELRFSEIGKNIGKSERHIKKLIKPNEKPYKNLQKAEQEWMRLQGKEKVYKADVELDQIMTFFRVGFINICCYLVSEIFKESGISLVRLLQTILLLPAFIEETETNKKVTLQHNPKDLRTMSSLSSALKNFNRLGIKTLGGKQIEFKIGNMPII